MAMIAGLNATGVGPKDIWKTIAGTAQEAKQKPAAAKSPASSNASSAANRARRISRGCQRKLCGKDETS